MSLGKAEKRSSGPVPQNRKINRHFKRKSRFFGVIELLFLLLLWAFVLLCDIRWEPIFSMLVLLDLLFAFWCLGAIWFQRWTKRKGIRIAEMVLFGALSFALAAGSFRFWFLLPAGVLLSCGVLLPWLLLMRPRRDQKWQISCSRMPTVHFSPDGKTVTIGNIRDFHYRSRDDFDVRYRTETYALSDLVSMDYAIIHWGHHQLFGHVIVSFGFSDGRHLALSGETRLAEGDKKNFFAGLYRQYELIYILGTEEDLFQLRTAHRHEKVYLYPLNISPEYLSLFFTDLVQRAADLERHPEFYNTLRNNCTNSLMVTGRKFGFACGIGPGSAVNGLDDRIAYYAGILKRDRPDEPFPAYKKRHFVNPYADSPEPADYSRRIRGFSRD